MNAKILVIDDLRDSLDLLRRLLARHLPDCPVETTDHGEEGIEIARTWSPDLIILDANMPGMDGFEICRRLRADPAAADARILMLSGVLTDLKNRVSGMESGADSYLVKPFETEELVAQLKVLYRAKQSEDAMRRQQAALARELAERTALLQKSETHLRLLLDQMPAVLWTTDEELRCTSAAGRGLSQLGLSSRDVVGHLIVDLFEPEDAARNGLDIYRRALAGESVSFNSRYKRRSFSCHVEPFRNEAGWVTGTIGIALDTTDAVRAAEKLRQTEEQLRQAQKMEAVGRLAGGVAHDLNNMLTAIMGYSRFLLDSLTPDNPLRVDLDEIIRAGDRANKLTRQLLAFSRKQVLQMRPTDLNSVVEEMDLLLRRTLGEDIELVVLLGEELGSVIADASQIEQVILNLAVNARDAMRQGGKLTIETRRVRLPEDDPGAPTLCPPGDYIRLAVRDTGAGMTEEACKHAFEPFFTTKERGKGTGLGLATVYSIVRQSRGFISFSTEENRGTEFRIYFPRVSTVADVELKSPPKELPRGNETILLVEDEDMVRKMTVRILESLGYKVIEARHGEEALKLISESSRPIDLVLTDVVMPRMGGPDLVDRLNKMGLPFKAVFISGFTGDPINQVAPNGQRYPLIVKPFTRETIAVRIRQVLDGA